MARPSNQAQRRAQIVEGLRVVMAKEGYAKATVASLAQAAGLSPGLVHHHFASKGTVLLALVDRLAEEASSRQGRRLAALGPTASPEAKVDAAVEAFLALGPDAAPEAVGAWCMVGAEAQREAEVARVYGACLARWREGFQALILACPGVAPEGASHAAAALLAFIEGAYRVATAAPGSVPSGFAAQAAKQAWRAWAWGESRLASGPGAERPQGAS